MLLSYNIINNKEVQSGSMDCQETTELLELALEVLDWANDKLALGAGVNIALPS